MGEPRDAADSKVGIVLKGNQAGVLLEGRDCIGIKSAKDLFNAN